MPTFGPVGSLPVAAVPSGSGIVVYPSATGRLQFRPGGGTGTYGSLNYNLTVGHLSTSSPSEDFWGWSTALSIGSIDNNLMPDGSTILGIYWENNHTAGTRTLFLVVSGVHANSGWETINVDGHLHFRTDAAYSTASGNTVWSWTTTNHFGNTDGAVKVVTISGTSVPVVQYNNINMSKQEAALWLEPPAGIDMSRLEFTLWLDPHDLRMSKQEAALWLDIPRIQMSKAEVVLWLEPGRSDEPQITIIFGL